MSECENGANDEALNGRSEGKGSPNSVRPRTQDLLAILFTETQHPNTKLSFIIIFYDMFQSFIRLATGRGCKHIKEKCAILEQ
jgi:hypothetical protein